MSPAPGTRLGPYEITGPLGAGGMGEVYRARDTKLGREVAIKILPAALAADHERLARFEREAQALAALNHPNIAQVYAFESIAADTTSGAAPLHALVMELVEGPTLADRLAQGPLAMAEALPLARQLAEALEAAHEQGIVHRDLKPANIKVRDDGTVKVLDFGLAKAMERTSDPFSTSRTGLAESPTITSPAAMTRAGVVLGTAAYMSPEQARGKPVDRRTDIWAFGVVLYEMLTGRRVFDGETVSDAIASVLQTEPDLTRLPTTTPAPVRRLIERALRKDARQRLRDVGDARLVLDEVITGAPETEAPTPVRRPARRWTVALPWALAAVLAVVAIVASLRSLRQSATTLPVLQYTIAIPDLSTDNHRLPILSPDGRRLAYVRNGELWVRDLDQLEARQVTGLGDKAPQHPFWSPDSRQIGVFDQSALWRVPLDGGPPVLVAGARMNRGARTPTAVWRPDGLIVFAPSATGSGLLSVPATGGEFASFYERREGENDLHRPSLLPDGNTLVFVVDRTDASPDTIGILAGTTRKDLLTLKGERLDAPVYSPTGHILYQRETGAPGVWALPFSLERLEATGEPFLVAPGGTWPAVTSNGTLLYVDSRLTGQVRLVWCDPASGAVEPAFPGTFPALAQPALSPDGTRVVALTRGAGAIDNHEVVVLDLERQTQFQLARDASPGSARPRWRGADGLVYAREDATGADQVVSIRADGSGAATAIGPGWTPDVSRDGKHVVFVQVNAGTASDLWHAGLDDAAAAPMLLQRNPYAEDDPALSPDARLLAYTANETGQLEVYLRPFPAGAGRWLVSSNGGMHPVWTPRGDRLYYRNLQGLPVVVDVQIDAAGVPRLGTPRPITLPDRSAPLAAGIRTVFGFDVSLDGSRLLIVQNAVDQRQSDPSLVVVQNWLAATAPAAQGEGTAR